MMVPVDLSGVTSDEEAVARFLLEEVPGAMIVGGFARHFVMGDSDYGDIDLTLRRPEDREAAFNSLAVYSPHWGENDFSYKFHPAGDFEVQLLKTRFGSPLEVVNQFHHLGEMFALYLQDGEFVAEVGSSKCIYFARERVIELNPLNEDHPMETLYRIMKYHAKGWDVRPLTIADWLRRMRETVVQEVAPTEGEDHHILALHPDVRDHAGVAWVEAGMAAFFAYPMSAEE